MSEPKRGEMRGFAWRLMREVVARLGWRYRVYLPLSMAESAIFLLPPQLLKFFAEGSGAVTDESARDFVQLLLVYGAAIALCLWVAVFFGSLLAEWLRLKVSIGLRRQVLESLHGTRVEALDAAQRGDWLTRMTGDLRSCEQFLTDSVPNQIRDLTLMAGSGVLFFRASGWVALIPCGAAVVLAWLNVAVQRRMAPVLNDERDLEGDVFQSVIESFEGMRTIRSFGAEGFVEGKLGDRLGRLYRLGMRIMRNMGALVGLNELGGQLAITLVLSVAAWALKDGSVTVSDVLVYPFYIGMFLNSAKGLVASTYQWNRYFIEGGRLGAVFYGAGRMARAAAGDENPGARLAAGFRRMEVSGLEAGYEDGPAVLRGFGIAVAAGETVAVMGPSGSGKSTLLEVLAGLRTARAGRFRVATASGEEDLERVPIGLAGYVEQRPYVFAGSWRENLGFGAALEDAAVWDALGKVEMDAVVRERGGLDAALMDRGQNLSEGQRYRLALARALLAGRPVLLVDEPFAALDGGSVRSVVRALEGERARGVAVVVVTHSLPEGFEAGRIVALG